MTEQKKIEKQQFNSLLYGLSPFHIEANRSAEGMSIVLSGIVGISDFSDGFICFKSHGGRIKVFGQSLFLNVYEAGNAEIVGKIQEIAFDYGKT
jgi:hypothetical protein